MEYHLYIELLFSSRFCWNFKFIVVKRTNLIGSQLV